MASSDEQQQSTSAAQDSATAQKGADSSTVASSSTDAKDTSTAATSSTSSTDIAAAATTGSIDTRITEWRLAPTEIQADLDRGVTIVRTREVGAGAPTGSTDDAVLITMVKGKLQADSQVSSAAANIDVEANNGEVTLKGKAPSADVIGRAIALALNTEGVTKVSSELKIDTATQ